jgi:hypothetical protein
MASWSPGGTLDWWVRGGHHSSPKTREPEPCGSGSLLRRRHLQRVVKGSPSNAFGPPAANERHGRWLTLTPNLSGTGLRHEYPRVRYGNQPRGPAVAADAEDHLYARGPRQPSDRDRFRSLARQLLELAAQSLCLSQRAAQLAVGGRACGLERQECGAIRRLSRHPHSRSSCLPTTFSAL